MRKSPHLPARQADDHTPQLTATAKGIRQNQINSIFLPHSGLR
jgi:hypothetical protein